MILFTPSSTIAKIETKIGAVETKIGDLGRLGNFDPKHLPHLEFHI